ncbi:hypothetical protein KVR01_009213 [Diaporthe batatas]|uniref:uncharacterized protein n=1 Tax=Diaporthe batatas TaxID=748121 RepID=UPI001D047821|nr:uncharacterized protein KVR01_009213 [Diaporthe batatas]KAG8160949.1 hypothetical protein KVR01_009213 [Diaporthe batatas]
MAHMRMLTPEASPEPETRPSGLWQPKPASATNNSPTNNNAAATQQQQHEPQSSSSSSSSSSSQQKRKRSWPFPTTRPVSPPSSTSPAMMRDDDVGDDDQRPGIKAMWESNATHGLSRTAASRGRPPFQDAHLEDDVQPIFEGLIRDGVDDAASPEYALAFYPRAHELALHAENALLHHGDRAAAAALYLRACALLRVGRYSSSSSSSPPPSCPPDPAAEADAGPCPIRARAWHLQKSYHTRAGRLLGPDEPPLDEVLIPHTHDAATRPDEGRTGGVRERGSVSAAAAATNKTKAAGPARPQVPAVVRLPRHTLRTGSPCPAVLVATGDRTAHTALCGELLARGWGCVVVETPGCGDCPVAGAGAGAGAGGAAGGEAAALWASVLDWMAAIRVFDMGRVVVWAAAAASASSGPLALVGQFAGAAGGGLPRVRGCVALVSGGGSAVMAAGGGGGGGDVVDGDGWAASNGRVLVVADNDHDDGLVLSEYGALDGGAGRAVLSVAAGSAAVYDWVEDLLSPDLVV